MARYFFNIEDGASIPDKTGTELPNLRSARMEAVRLSGKLLHEEPDLFWDSGDDWKMIVTDDAGLILFSLHFAASGAPDTPRIYQSLTTSPSVLAGAGGDGEEGRWDNEGGSPVFDAEPEQVLSPAQMAATVHYQRSNRSMGLDAVADGMRLHRRDLVGACRINEHFARELNFREDRDGSW
jgi:hypothetical protein